MPLNMDSILNRLKSALMLKSNYTRLGAWIMLLSSIAFFNFMTLTYNVIFVLPSHHRLVGTVGAFLIGALLAHGIQNTTFWFLQILGLNVYIIGWAFIANGILVANTNLGVYFNGFIGVFILFLGVVLFYIEEENPSRNTIKTHVLVGIFFVFVGAVIFLLAYFETEINLFLLISVRRIPAFWSHKAIVTALVGNGFLLISLFMFFLPPYIKREGDRFI